MEINFHAGQRKVWDSQARFKVVTPGRRWGKTTFARSWVGLKGLDERCPNGTSLIDSPVAYVSPSNKSAMQHMYRPLKTFLKELGVFKAEYKKDQVFELINGRLIMLAGADSVDSLRGYSFGALCVDETKDIKREMLEDVLMPACMDKQAPCLYIGTPPEGKSGPFYEMYMRGKDPAFPDWATFEGSSWDNPYNPPEELQRLKEIMHPFVYRKEVLGEFCSESGDFFKAEDFEIVQVKDVPKYCSTYIACDIAGMGDVKGRQRDETAIAIVCIDGKGVWYVLNITHGQWDPKETAQRIMGAYNEFEPLRLGIEKGTTKNAVGPYLNDEMYRCGRHFEVFPLSTGNKAKSDRIVWSLQGRVRSKRLKLVEGAWNGALISQACDFPDTKSRDDLLDALAYIDQLSGGNHINLQSDGYFDSFKPLDAIAGY